MNTRFLNILCVCTMIGLTHLSSIAAAPQESPEERAHRMSWWREARFGMFIHWGLYAIPAGTWGEGTDFGEWIRHSARIPLEEYERLVPRFNPLHFDAAAWVTMAKNAGMKYIVITSKHHDGFCLFDSRQTAFDVMATPFRRDILKELSDECRRQGIRMCWYYSIMDWHQPDYLPRREWETARSTEGADFERYIRSMKEQLRELITSYGEIGVLWFDGEWEHTWNRERGRDLAAFVRSLQPTILLNNRVDGGRSGMEGFTHGEPSAGDFGTPEQQVPATGLPGMDWETCMTMNDHWGYNAQDDRWKSSSELIRTLVDIVSKGGNFLLNIGPRADGTFPDESVDRLHHIGSWMQINSASVYGTSASPFRSLPWGRCTQKPIAAGTRLYLHVFDWPSDGVLDVPGLLNPPLHASLLADSAARPLMSDRLPGGLRIHLPRSAPDTIVAVVMLDIAGIPDVCNPPEILTAASVFVDSTLLTFGPPSSGTEIRFTLDGSVPGPASLLYTEPVSLTATTTVSARCFRNGIPITTASKRLLERVAPLPALSPPDVVPGIRYQYFEGTWDILPTFASLQPLQEGIQSDVALSSRLANERYGFVYTGLVRVPERGVYSFAVESDDGSKLWIDTTCVVDNDGLHGLQEISGVAALEAGFHRIRVEYFQNTGGDGLRVTWAPAGEHRRPISPGDLYHIP